jgi:hypothetical protein
MVDRRNLCAGTSIHARCSSRASPQKPPGVGIRHGLACDFSGGPVSKRQGRESNRSSDSGWTFTSGDLSRLLHVDLKTIHNWVGAGHLVGRRTEGRHLRFDRVEVVRFMRSFRYPVPQAVAIPPPTVLWAVPNGTRPQPGLIGAQVFGVFETALQLGTGAWEIAIVDLRVLSSGQIREFTRALRAFERTRTTGLVGLSDHRAHRGAFLDGGGDIAMAPKGRRDAARVVDWFTGARGTLPASLDVSTRFG